MALQIITHPSSHDHVTPPGHPERVARIERVDQVLAQDAFAGADRAEAPAAGEADLKRAHTPAYVDGIIAAAPDDGWVSLDADTHMSPGSLTAAYHAAGSNMAAVEAVSRGDARAAFCAVRPCGHHAERERAMGFCLFSNVAVGALYALDVLGMERIAIVDFDVHHGNGTQDIFWNDQPGDVFLDAPDAAVSRHRGGGRAWRARQHPQRAAAPADRHRGDACSLREPGDAGGARA